MATIPTDGAALAAAPAASARTSARWLREPLFHFLALGAILFAADHAIVAARGDARAIFVDAAVDAQARQAFKSARGREPGDKELFALRRVWLDNEVLYREGLAMGVDKGDPAIRDRVIFKALEIVSANLKPPPIDDAGLRAWFEKNRARYDEPPRYDFEEAVPVGERSEGVVRGLVAQLASGVPGEVSAGLRIFKGRPLANVVDGYGPEFTTALDEGLSGKWRAMQSRDGWRAIRLLSIAPAKPALYEALRAVVRQDWLDTVMAEQRSAAVAALAGKYRILVEERK